MRVMYIASVCMRTESADRLGGWADGSCSRLARDDCGQVLL
jgi:hypothetical protein